MASPQEMLEWRGRTMVSASGDPIGTIEAIFLDNDTGAPEWALVHTGMSGSSSTFVPLAQADSDGSSVVVPYEKAQVTDAPQLERDQELSQDDEAELYRFYGLGYGEGRSDSGLPEGDRREQHTDDAMTRSEEQLRVGTEVREAGRARLRKQVVTEQVTESIPVRREVVRITREPITEATADPAHAGLELSTEEHEITLHEEVPVVKKEVVAVERIRLDTATGTDQEQISEQVRKEQIEVDDSDNIEPRR